MISRSLRSSKTFITLVVSVSVFTDILLQNLVVPVLPFALSERVGLTDSGDIQRWNSILLSAFGGALIIGSLFFGYLGDRIPGRRAPFLFGVLVLAASTVSFAVGDNLPILLAARILEGFSAAIVGTLGSALLRDTFGAEHIGKAMGYTSLAVTSALLLGPAIGGLLYEYGGYFQVFLPAYCLLVVEVILRLLIIEKEKPLTPRLHEHSAFKENPVHDGQVGNVEQGPGGPDPDSLDQAQPGEPEAQQLLPKTTHERPRQALLILLASPRFLVAMIGTFIVSCIACGFDGVLAPYTSDTFGLKATHAAALFLSMALPMFLAPIPSALTDRYGAKLPAAAGFVLAIPSLTLLRLVSPGTDQPFVKLLILLGLAGTSFAFTGPPLRVEAARVVAAIEQDRPGVFGPNGAYSQAFGLINASMAAGSMLGPLYAGYTRVWLGWGAMSLSMGIMSLMMLVLVLLVTGGRKQGQTCDG
ncbi:MAG: hypothetical protein Q9196_000695 [Gyalolechia fulgens]